MKTLFFSILIFLALVAGLKAQSPQKSDFTPQESSPTVSQNKIKITGRALKVEDILIKEGDRVVAGQPLISRALEIRALESNQAKALERLNFLQAQEIPKPIEPIAREFANLPASNFNAEEMRISALRSRCDREVISLETLKSEDLGFSSNAGLSKLENLKQHKSRELFQAQDLLNNLSSLGFEPHYIAHQTEKIKKLTEEVEKIDNDILVEQGRLQEQISAFQKGKTEAILKAEFSVADCQERLQIAEAELQKSRYNRELLEQQHARSLAIYLQEQDKSAQIYQRDLADYQKSIEAQKLRLFELESALSDIEFKLSEITEVKSPYDGEIVRIKIVNSTDGFINVEFTLNY